jgi:two-component system sensor histidine kinase KdpD
MAFFTTKQGIFLKKFQLPISLCIIIGVSWILFFSVPIWGYRIPALVLLMVVSLFALVFEILTVLISAILSALIWNFFFIPPLFTFHIANGEDGLMFLMYFIIALVHTTLSFKIKQLEKLDREKQEKEQSIKLYNTLLNSLSHELKTPIAAIIGAVDTIKDTSMVLSEANKNELINQVGIAGLRLNKEVENLLNMSRVESGSIKLKLDWTDINELVHLVISKLDEKSKDFIIQYTANETLPFMKMDSSLMEQVLYNLIYNAILYTPKGTVINISVAVHSDHCEIEVVDNGPGFPAEEVPNVFKMFYRLPHHKTGGSGLGLSIVKGFVEAHNGTIQLISKENEGARFLIKLPLELSYLNNINNE